MYFGKKHYRNISLFIMLCIIASCFNIHISAISLLSSNNFNSDFQDNIYTTYISNADSDACTPEMLGRQEFNFQSDILNKSHKFSHKYKILPYIINIIDSIHIPLYHSLVEKLSNSCELISTVIIIRYIHSQDGKKKGLHNFLSQ